MRNIDQQSLVNLQIWKTMCIYGRCSTYGENGLLAPTKCVTKTLLEEWCFTIFIVTQRVTLPQLLFTHFNRAKQLPAFSKSGTLGANRSKKIVQQMSVIKIWHLTITITALQFFYKLIHFKPSYQLSFLRAIFCLKFGAREQYFTTQFWWLTARIKDLVLSFQPMVLIRPLQVVCVERGMKCGSSRG